MDRPTGAGAVSLDRGAVLPTILSVNCGSSSLKLDVFDLAGNEPPCRRAAVRVTDIGGRARLQVTDYERAGPARQISGGYSAAMREGLAELARLGVLGDIAAVGHRVVHGGGGQSGPALIDAATLGAIEEAESLAPLHNRPALEALHAARDAFPALPMVAVFDTAFFHDLPPVAAAYALPREFAARFQLRRFGFHGLAHECLTQRYAELRGSPRGRVVTLQLGNGCSAAAVLDGRPVDTSMGFTPLEGLVMGTRSGDIDPAIPGFLSEHAGLSAAEVERLLNEESGLAGLAGRGGDARRLLEAEAQGDQAARLALDLFCYRVRKYVGAYAAALGGLDGIMFGGGIGENAPALRERICAGLGWLGLTFDPDKNADPERSGGVVSADQSRVLCAVVAVDEGPIIARQTRECLKKAGSWP
jgi:acetate kinase